MQSGARASAPHPALTLCPARSTDGLTDPASVPADEQPLDAIPALLVQLQGRLVPIGALTEESQAMLQEPLTEWMQMAGAHVALQSLLTF